MNHLHWASLLVFLSTLIYSCNSENQNTPETTALEGVWHLTAWNVVQGLDMDQDGTAHTNLLDEISCENAETLEFDTHGIVSFNNSFSPDLKITRVPDNPGKYNFDITCDNKRILGSASTFKKSGKTLMIGDTPATINGNEITIVRKNKIKIFDQSLTKLQKTLDVSVVYTKI